MKIQLESVEAFENIFKEILSTEENAKHTESELDVLLHIKNLFLKNVEIGGEELDIGQVTQEKIERKKEHSRLIGQVEETERNKIQSLKDLCTLRRELPQTLREEIKEKYKNIRIQLEEKSNCTEESKKEVNSDEDISIIKKTVSELLERLPVVIEQIKEQITHVEKEVKESIEQKGREIQTETLSLLFKDELELSE